MGVVSVLIALVGVTRAINAKGCTPLDAWTFDKVRAVIAVNMRLLLLK